MNERRGPPRPPPAGVRDAARRTRPRTWAAARARPPSPVRWLAAGILIGAGLGFAIARRTATPLEGATVTAAAPLDGGALATEDAGAPVAITSTSTVGLCPCPPPRRPRATSVVPKRRPAVTTPPFTAPDPTAETARYLREQARTLGECAPPNGAELRVHLELTVAPSGEIEAQRITNVDPVPGDVVRCIERVIGTLAPPGFDASASEVFVLTVVL